MKYLFLSIALVIAAAQTHAKVRIVTTLSDLADFAAQIGGDRVQIDFIVRGNQNPHFIEVKPSYMMKLRNADLFFMIGMELELWAPQIIDGSRNSSLVVVDLSKNIRKLEVPSKLDASEGDVHRYGNPHYWLDPRNVRVIVGDMTAALIKEDPAGEKFFRANSEAYLKQLDAKIREWEALLAPHRGASVITFHRSWSYFMNWAGLTVADYIEPKPGIQPSPSHIAALLKLVRGGAVKVIVVEPFYDDNAPRQIAGASNVKVLRLSTSVGGTDTARDYITMMDQNVRTLKEALK